MGPSLRTLGIVLVWAGALWPLVLTLLSAAATPLAAVTTARIAAQVLTTTGLVAGGACLALGLLWPPFLPHLRLWLANFRQRVRTDPARLHEILTSLQHLDTAAARLDAARDLLAANRRAEAIAHLQRALELAPEQQSTRFLLGRTLCSLGRTSGAIPHLEAVVAADPGHAFGQALLELGTALLAVGQHAAALSAFQRHERAHGPSRRSSYSQAVLYRRLGNAEAGSRALQHAVAQPANGQRLAPEEALWRARARVAGWIWRVRG